MGMVEVAIYYIVILIIGMLLSRRMGYRADLYTPIMLVWILFVFTPSIIAYCLASLLFGGTVVAVAVFIFGVIGGTLLMIKLW